MKKFFVTLLAALFILGMATSAFAANGTAAVDNSIYSNDSKYGTLAVPLNGNWDPADVDNGINNVNQSGVGTTTDDGSSVGQVIKSDNMTGIDGLVGTQRTHGQYQNNTNSCASCHQTHTAAAGELLIKDGVFNTCASCHDGTLGFYNVFGMTEAVKSDDPNYTKYNGSIITAGTFGASKAGNGSMHLANGAVAITVAPGGNNAGGAKTTEYNSNEAWTQAFDCSACHAPHGSYSDRLLQYNPNNMAAEPVEEGGQGFVHEAVFTTIPTADADSPELAVVIAAYKTDLAALTATGPYASKWAASYTSIPGTVPVAVVVKKYEPSHGVFAYQIDTTPWIEGHDYDATHTRWDTSVFWKTSADPLKPASTDQLLPGTNLTYKYGYSYAYGNDLKNAVAANIARAYVTKLQYPAGVSNGKPYAATAMIDVTAPNGWKYQIVDTKAYMSAKVGVGIGISQYCAACHTDYLASSGEAMGVFSSAYRHTTNTDSYPCLKCHYAHGTDVQIMLDAQNRGLTVKGVDSKTAVEFFAGDTAKATAYLLDQNASSALKRYTNMAVCWRCHTSSHNSQLVNNEYYMQTNQDAPHGF